MEIKTFVSNFAAQFDETDPATLTAATKFAEIVEWSSLQALCIIAMIDEQYGITINGEDIRNSETIEDLFNIVKSRV